MLSNEKTCVIIEARMTSTRLPGKVLMEVLEKPMLQLMVERLRCAKTIDDIIIATTVNNTDDPVFEFSQSQNIPCYRGSEHDVLSRVLEAAKSFDIDVIVEIPGDCPLIDARYVDLCVEEYRNSNVDYVSSVLSNSFPHGTEAQVFSTKLLEDVEKRTNDPSDREHVTLYIYNHPEIYSIKAVEAPEEVARNDIHLTLDEPADFELISSVYNELYPRNRHFTLVDVLSFLTLNSEVLNLNDAVKRTVV